LKLKAFLAGTALLALLATSAPWSSQGQAFAEEPPKQSHRDPRIRYVDYRADDVVPIWSTVGAVMAIEFGAGESVPDGMVSIPDVWNSKEHKGALEVAPQANILTLKFHSCMIREPMLVTTRLPSGALRLYAFEVHTVPDICPGSGRGSPGMVSAMPVSATTETREPQGNLRYVGRDDLGAGSDADYEVIFRYPLDEAAKRRAARQLAAERASKREIALLLQQQTDNAAATPGLGSRNYRYIARGDLSLTPSLVFDDGYSTTLEFPGMQRMPALFRVLPDGTEATSDYSVHGNAIVAPGLARLWKLRDGRTVLEIMDLAYTAEGNPTGTATVSPYVRRELKALDGNQ
jgi:type IV secretion system protein VirB9